MKDLLVKEMKLSASILTYLFLAFGLMTMIPGYPILVGAFFICFGIFQSFQAGRENEDIMFTVLLPVKKSDAVAAKFLFACTVEGIGFCIMLILTVLRMTLLGKASVYTENPMMNANPAFLAYVLLLFALFNYVFIGGFFRTAYKFGKPFVTYIILGFLLIAATETLHHLPGLQFLNATGWHETGRLWIMTICAIGIYVLVNIASFRVSKSRFEKIDL